MADETTKPQAAEQPKPQAVEQPKPQAAEQPKPQAVEQPKPQTPQAKPAVEKQTNCPACNKQIRKLKRYYRNGKFYCSKICWRKAIKPKEVK